MSDVVSFLNTALLNTGKNGMGELRHLMYWLDKTIYSVVDNLVNDHCPESFDEMGSHQPRGKVAY